MKYRTKDTHPELKEGIEITLFSDREAGGNIYSSVRGLYIIAEYQLKMELEKGYIEEIQEPEFTKYDMIDILRKYDEGHYGQVGYEGAFKEWLNSRK